MSFIRQRGLAVVATRGPDGTPQAALVGVAVTDQAEIILSPPPPRASAATSKPDVAVAIGWDLEVTVQCEGSADILIGASHSRSVTGSGSGSETGFLASES